MKIPEDIWLSFATCGIVLGGGSYAQLQQLIESRPAPPVPAGQASWPAATEAPTAAIRPAGRWQQWRPLVATPPN